jgi:hypothetical protein
MKYYAYSSGRFARLAQDEEPGSAAVKREAEEDWSKGQKLRAQAR